MAQGHLQLLEACLASACVEETLAARVVVGMLFIWVDDWSSLDLTDLLKLLTNHFQGRMQIYTVCLKLPAQFSD